MAADNLQKGTFEARRLVCDHVPHQGGVCDVELTPQLLAAATGARQNYLAYLEEQYRLKEKENISSKKRKLIDEVEEVKKRRK